MITFPFSYNFGYACINTRLRKQDVFCSRTLRLATLQEKGVEEAKKLAQNNLEDLLIILQWNKENNILFFRLSSEMFPFATHKDYLYSLDSFDPILKKIGEYARENNIRLTTHPGQYNVLSCKDPRILENTIRELNHHSDILDRMGMGADSVIIIHGGGVYSDKQASLQRLESNYMLLSESTRNRLVLENCEMSYSIEDLLPISEKLKVPLVIDFHHNHINPSKENILVLFERVYSVWKERKITPKIHVSNSIPGVKNTDSKTARRKHSDYISYFHKEIFQLHLFVKHIDIMLECKMKEDAIISLLHCKKCQDEENLTTY
jgi:UV DNA damage endonuclease